VPTAPQHSPFRAQWVGAAGGRLRMRSDGFDAIVRYDWFHGIAQAAYADVRKLTVIKWLVMAMADFVSVLISKVLERG
jgi:hypothetical protein